ncbi:UNVERIFIED_CONTAM: hypothetical protein Sradi_4940900 [Sesamum radiatum]|uniref:DUF4283 domain-containing protein n=1 Tax=Sesamum radiatum TaxID=300843 RepID=A0AAW2MDX7_SESRA
MAKTKKSKVQAEPMGGSSKMASLPSTATILVSTATANRTTVKAPATTKAAVMPSPESVKMKALTKGDSFVFQAFFPTWRSLPLLLPSTMVTPAMPPTLLAIVQRQCYRLKKFTVEDETLKLETNDLIDVRAKLGHCLVGYIADKFARDEDRQRILAGGPYFVYGRPLLLKNIPDCFEFKEDDTSLTLVWATLPSLQLECWHPNALGKISSRLGTSIAIDSLTMKMRRVSYARILVEVDASKKLVDQVEFIFPNGVASKQSVVYEFTPMFCLHATVLAI